MGRFLILLERESCGGKVGNLVLVFHFSIRFSGGASCSVSLATVSAFNGSRRPSSTRIVSSTKCLTAFGGERQNL